MTKRRNGEGSIFQRSDHSGWVVAWSENGRQRRRYAPTEAAALEILDDVRHRLRRGRAGADARDSFAAIARLWSEVSLELEPIKDSSKRTYRDALRLWVLPRIGDLRLKDIVRSDVEGMLVGMRHAGLSGQAQRTALTVARKVLDYAVDNRLLLESPATRVRRPKATPKRDRVVPEVDAVRRVLAVAGPDDAALFTIVAYTGMRPGEALALTWADVDLDAGRVSIVGTLYRDRSTRESRKTETKTTASERTLYLAPPVVAALRAWRKRQAEVRLAAPYWHDGPGWVFTSPYGRVRDGSGALKALKATAAAAGVPADITFRSLRHTAATTLLESGVPMKVAAELLGHSRERTTSEVYTTVRGRMRDEGAAALAAALGER